VANPIIRTEKESWIEIRDDNISEAWSRERVVGCTAADLDLVSAADGCKVLEKYTRHISSRGWKIIRATKDPV